MLSKGNDLIGQLHGCDDVEHVGGITHLLFLQQLEMVQAGAAHQDFQPLFFIPL